MVAGGEARYERNPRNPPKTRMRPEGGARTSANRGLLPPFQGGFRLFWVPGVALVTLAPPPANFFLALRADCTSARDAPPLAELGTNFPDPI